MNSVNYFSFLFHYPPEFFSSLDRRSGRITQYRYVRTVVVVDDVIVLIMYTNSMQYVMSWRLLLCQAVVYTSEVDIKNFQCSFILCYVHYLYIESNLGRHKLTAFKCHQQFMLIGRDL